MPAVISVEHLSKAYRLGMIGTGTLHEDLNLWWAKVRGRSDPLVRVGDEHHTRRLGARFWALENVSFDVEEGEVLGIIGPNGAGKSTLLKILSQVTAPTSGQVTLRGRVASLLEVGTGFHPDLTGRENIFLNGAILGMTKAEIRSKFDEIVAFSECEEFIDTPVKRYSSGMYVRLAFAVAAQLEPEILIVDEVLAVGDARFQKKCLGMMGDVAQRGRTVLFVSHNMVAMRTFCNRCLLLRDGQVVVEGKAVDVINAYIQTDAQEIAFQEWAGLKTAPGAAGFRFNSVRLRPRDAANGNHLTVQSAFDIEVSLSALRTGRINLSLHLYQLTGEVVCAVVSPVLKVVQGEVRFTCQFPGNLLNDSMYSLSVMIVEDGSRPLFDLRDALRFEIHDVVRQGAWQDKWPGFVRPQLPWTCQQP